MSESDAQEYITGVGSQICGGAVIRRKQRRVPNHVMQGSSCGRDEPTHTTGPISLGSSCAALRRCTVAFEATTQHQRTCMGK